MSNTFFTNNWNLDEMVQAAREGNLPDSLVVIDQIEQVIQMLTRQDVQYKEHIMRLLRNSQELVRKAHEVAWKEVPSHGSTTGTSSERGW